MQGAQMDGARSDIASDLAPRASDAKRQAALLEGLRAALAEPAEQRLYRSGKLSGLFVSRVGAAGEAAQEALRRGLVESTRVEVKSRTNIEWVRLTPRGIEFLHEHDSPQAVLGTLQETLRLTRNGIPVFLEQLRIDLHVLADRWAGEIAQVVARLDGLAERVDLALRRFEASGPSLSENLEALVPWGLDALTYLDHRTKTGMIGNCPLPELFHALRPSHPRLSLLDFQDGLRRLFDAGAIHLDAAKPEEMFEPEYVLVLGSHIYYYAHR